MRAFSIRRALAKLAAEGFVRVIHPGKRWAGTREAKAVEPDKEGKAAPAGRAGTNGAIGGGSKTARS